jgi:hypothetical protein
MVKADRDALQDFSTKIFGIGAPLFFSVILDEGLIKLFTN